VTVNMITTVCGLWFLRQWRSRALSVISNSHALR